MSSKKEIYKKLVSADAILIYASLLKFFLLLLFAGNYGIFRDEYYYVACSENLAWGYVDQPPFSALMLLISRSIFGNSIFGIRIFAYLAGSILIFVSGLIAREMGGGKFAQGLTAFVVIFSGVVLGTTSYFSMNSFDLLFSSLMFYYLIKLLKSGSPKYWYAIGLIFGIGLMNKLSFLFLGFGLAVGLILTEHRKFLLKKELWISAAIAVLIFLPNIIWQIANHFPTIEFMSNAAKYKNQPMGILEFSKNAAFELNPGFTVVILIALYFLFFSKNFKNFRLIGWLIVSVFLVFMFNNGKPYYMGILYPTMLAAGSVGLQIIIEKYSLRWLKSTAVIYIIPFAALTTPFAVPVLPVDTFIKFSDALGLKPGVGERSEQGILPQFYADRFGWEQLAKEVGEVYNKLSDEEKKNVLVYGQNYGEAGAVDFYAEKYNLPPAISGHNNYWLWGYPSKRSGKVMIVIGSNYEDNSRFFGEVELAARHYNKYGMPYENVDIFICRKPKISLKELWPKVKIFI